MPCRSARHRQHGPASPDWLAVVNAPALPDSLHTLLAALGTSTEGHSVFSRHGVPLLLLPKDRALAKATVGLYRPQTAKAKDTAAVLRLLCGAGLHCRFLPTFPGESNKMGILLCNPSHGTRVVAVRARPDGHLEIAKTAHRDDAEPLRREHTALTKHQGKAGVPKVGPLEERSNAVWFSMPYLRDATRDADPRPLLSTWETDEREPAEQNGLIQDLLPLLEDKARAGLARQSVRRVLVHGDFAPWNWRADDAGNLVCIDWEWAREDGFAGFDLVYCIVQQALLIKKIPSNQLVKFIEKRLSRLDADGQSCLRETGLPISVLVSLVLAYRRSKGMEDPSDGDNAPSSQRGAVGASAYGALAPPAPRFLALEGADGVGKSTVLRLLVPEIVCGGGYKGYLFFHWKPIKRNLSYDVIPGDAPHNPRGKKPRNPMASLMFLAHHWLDFQLGYWRFVRPAIRSGRLVVADRYTYDVLLDPKRFRLRLPVWTLRLFVRTIPRPDRAILLHADPTVIHARKSELTEAEITAYQSALLSCMLIRDAISIDATQTPDHITNNLLPNFFPCLRDNSALV